MDNHASRLGQAAGDYPWPDIVEHELRAHQPGLYASTAGHAPDRFRPGTGPGLGPALAARRQDTTTASGHSACAAPKPRSARPACPPPVISSAPNQASRASSTVTAPADTAGRRPHGTDGPRRQAPAGQATSAAHPAAVQIMCGSGKLIPGCSGFTATRTPAAAAAIRISRPGALAGRSEIPVTTSQAPTTRNVSVITNLSAAPDAASTLTGWATGSKERGCSPAATVHPATISTGAAADETTPHHGTPRTTTTVTAGAAQLQQPDRCLASKPQVRAGPGLPCSSRPAPRGTGPLAEPRCSTPPCDCRMQASPSPVCDPVPDSCPRQKRAFSPRAVVYKYAPRCRSAQPLVAGGRLTRPSDARAPSRRYHKWPLGCLRRN